MSADLLYGVNQGWIFLISLALFYACAEFGYRLGNAAAPRLNKEATTHVGTIEGALLGLLALLLGFAFSMAMDRYDNRRSVVVNEANDLQTTYLRSKLLHPPHNTIVADLLKQYVDSRVEYLKAAYDQLVLQNALNRTSALQRSLWQQATLAAQENNDEVRTGYFIESLNNLIDDHTRRVAAMGNHVPEIILLLLFFVAAMTIAMTGYSSGLNQTRLGIPRFILILLTSATLMVIIDLDRPKRGFIKVTEKAMLELQRELNTPSAS
jgi:hypothetical protein